MTPMWSRRAHTDTYRIPLIMKSLKKAMFFFIYLQEYTARCTYSCMQLIRYHQTKKALFKIEKATDGWKVQCILIGQKKFSNMKKTDEVWKLESKSEIWSFTSHAQGNNAWMTQERCYAGVCLGTPALWMFNAKWYTKAWIEL